MEPAEDLPYSVSPAAQPPDSRSDVDVNNIPLLVKHLADLDGWIAKHNTLDVLDDTSKLSAEQQKVVHRQLVVYLRVLRQETSNKIKRLKDGQR